MKQQKLFKLSNYKSEFGGSLLKNKRKSKRPISLSKPIHAVLKSERTDLKIFFSPRDKILRSIIKKMASKYKIRIYRFAINYSHFHFLLQTQSREAYTNFSRQLAAQIVAHMSRKYEKNLKG